MEDYDLASTLTETKCDVLGYTVLAMIDYGSFGDVFKVKNHANNQMCALKQIRFKRDFRNDPYIINELYCLTHLTHKNVVKLYEIIIEDGEINIVMEYAEKENLQRYLTLNDKLEFHQKYKIYSQVLEGMKYCHSMDVAHRDMTPSNVLLNADMVVKIADFGLAVRCFTKQGDPVECTDYLGHASYLAPEVLSQKPFRPKPTDIWSLGITLIYILFRDTPYHGFESDILEDQLKHSWRDFVGRKAIDQDCIVQDDVTEFIKKALELDPNRRCNICDLVRRWDAIDPTTTNSYLISFPNTDAF